LFFSVMPGWERQGEIGADSSAELTGVNHNRKKPRG